MQRTIFITGASSGLGRATAKLFHSKGWNVIATMRNTDAAGELKDLKGVTLLQLDVTDPEQIKAVVAKAESLHQVDVVLNNAGYGLSGALEVVSEEQISRQVSTNLLGVIYVTKAFVPYFRERKAGLFISITSIGGVIAFPLNSLYNATKFAVEGWSQSMSFELALHNIRIKTIAPGAIKTDFGGRSLDVAPSTNYEGLERKWFDLIDSMMDSGAEPEQMAEIVYRVTTDDTDQVHYIAGEDAEGLYKQFSEVGREAFGKGLKSQFLDQ